MLLGQPIRQIAYFVSDVRKAAARHSALYGSGPFLVNDPPPLPSFYRGKEGVLELTVAFGQWGALQVEFMQQNNGGPSILRELYPEGSGRAGLHHFACIVDDLDSAIEEFAKAGYTEASRILTPAADTVFIDMLEEEGHFLELYPSKPMIVAMYETVARASIGFDGSDPVRQWDFARWPLQPASSPAAK